jgi:hypothetical protein
VTAVGSYGRVAAENGPGQHGGVLGHPEERGGLALALEVHTHEMQSADHGAGAVLLERATHVVERVGKPAPAAMPLEPRFQGRPHSCSPSRID